MTAISTLLLGLAILIAGVIWYYLRFITLFLKLPSDFATLMDSIMLCIRCLAKKRYAHKNLLRKLEEMCRMYEKEGLLAIWLTQPVVLIFGPEFVKQILNEPAAIYKPNMYNPFKFFLKSSIFRSNGKKWKRQKKILKQAFKFALKEKKIDIINSHSGNLVKTLASIPNNTTNESLDIIKHSTLQIIIDCMFGQEVHFTERSLLIESLEHAMALIIERFFKPWLYPDFAMMIFPESRKCVMSLRKLEVVLSKMMETLKNNMLKLNNDDKKAEVVGEVLLTEHQQNPTMCMEELTQQILFLIIAAFDTTSLTLMWCLYLLGLHEEVQERLYLEVEEFEEDVSAEDLRKMEYAECVIREALRIYSTAPLVFRYLTKEVQCGKYTIPKGSTIALPLQILHKNPDMFPDPEKFDPERFRRTKNGDPRKLYTASFSEGLRPCLGKVDALIELKIMIAHVVRNFKIISLDQRKDVEVSFNFMLGVEKPLRMQFIPRRVTKDEGMFSTAKS